MTDEEDDNEETQESDGENSEHEDVKACENDADYLYNSETESDDENETLPQSREFLPEQDFPQTLKPVPDQYLSRTPEPAQTQLGQYTFLMKVIRLLCINSFYYAWTQDEDFKKVPK